VSGEHVPLDANNTSFSDPKPLDKETVSTQSVSHLDPDGVVFASFIFFYRSEHQLKKIGMIKPPARSLSTNIPPKPVHFPTDFSSLSSTGEVIPKGPNMFQNGRENFGGFRDASETDKKANGKRLNGSSEDDDLPLMTDELGRDPQDMERERKKTAEEVRMEEELAAQINRVKLKRSHSSSSLKSNGDPETPPETSAPIPNIFSPPNLNVPATETEPDTPAKKRKSTVENNVKSPSTPSRGLGFGGPPERGGPGFGGFLDSQAPLVSMMEEEEL
jgi:hypothetical protein